MFTAFYNTHKIVVTLFLLIYLVKTILLLTNKSEALTKFTKLFRIPEMIVSVLFLVTGIYLLTQMPNVNLLMIIKLVVVFASIPIAIIGFKKQNKTLAALSLVLIIAAYGLAEMSKMQLAKGSAGTSSQSLDGKELYGMYCTKCHGDDGKAGLVNATDLSLSNLEEAGIMEMIAHGKNTMPGFSNELNEKQITAIAEYVKKLRK